MLYKENDVIVNNEQRDCVHFVMCYNSKWIMVPGVYHANSKQWHVNCHNLDYRHYNAQIYFNLSLHNR